MSEQLSIFDSGIKCWYCGNDPGRKDGNGYAWNGFHDADTNRRVCRNCREKHYGEKAKTEFKGMYSEVPIVVETTLLIDKMKK